MNLSKVKFSKKQLNRFKKIGVETVYVFGSQTNGFTHPLSDIDIGVILSNPQKYENNTMKPYLELYDIFTDVFSNAKAVDIVLLQYTPIKLQFNAIKDGKIIYEKDKEKRFNYQENIMKQYCDLKYFYDLDYKYLLESL